MNESRAQWNGKLTFVLATAGSAIGLGNIWKFPYMAGMNGGSAFVLVYLLCIAAVGLPIFMAELYLGKKSQSNTVRAFQVLDKKNSPWQIAGWFGILSSFLILSFYSVIGGWVLDSVYNSVNGNFVSNTEYSQKYFSSLVGDGSKTIFLAQHIYGTYCSYSY